MGAGERLAAVATASYRDIALPPPEWSEGPEGSNWEATALA